MAEKWYYVQNKERVGPVNREEFKGLIKDNEVQDNTFVWKKGMEGWTKLKNIAEYQDLQEALQEDIQLELPDINDQKDFEIDSDDDDVDVDVDLDAEEVVDEAVGEKEFDWSSVFNKDRIFTIKIGPDRGEAEVEYGPYSLEIIKRLYQENRINGKTLIFASGMSDWIFLADIPVFERIFNDFPPVLNSTERRKNMRRPFVAKLFFHDSSVLYEGVCRDISVGGIQVLVSDFPGAVGDRITLNVHPDNSDLCFTAEGEIVRILNGKNGFALRFVNPSPDMEAAIKDYVEGFKE